MPIEHLGWQLTEISPELADAADVLSDQLRVHLHRLAEFLLPDNHLFFGVSPLKHHYPAEGYCSKGALR